MHSDVEILVLVDTGSTTSLAGPSLFQQIPQLCSRIEPHKSQATTVCSSVFPISGILPFDFKIEDKLLHVSLKFVETMPYQVLLGTDFLKLCGTLVDFKKLPFAYSRQCSY